MTDVISYRTNHYDELEKIALSEKTTVSALSSKIISEYIAYGKSIKEQKYICIPREIFLVLHESLDKNKFQDITKVISAGFINEIKFIHSDPSLKQITDFIQIWFDNNDLILIQTKLEGKIRFACSHKFGINWSYLAPTVCTMIFDNFNIKSKIIESQKDHFIFDVNI